MLDAEVVLSAANHVWKAVLTGELDVEAAEYAGHCSVVFPLSVVVLLDDVLLLSSLVVERPLLSRVI